MKIFIIGAGFTGTQLAKTLVAEKNVVVLIDNNPERVRHAGDELDCTVLEADGNNLGTLEKAGVADADALVVLTEDDEINMITCSLVDAAYPGILKIARVRNYAYYMRTTDAVRRIALRSALESRPLYGIDHMVSPDVEASDAIGQAIDHGAVGAVVELGGGAYGILSLPIGEGSPLAELPLRRLHEVPGWHYLVAYVEGASEAALPDGNTVLHAGDHVGILARTADLPSIAAFTGAPRGNLRKIALFGAERIGGLIAARQLAAQRLSLRERLFGNGRVASNRKNAEYTIVDPDAERCRDMAERFPAAQVLLGDVTDESLLAEEDLAASDLVVAASGDPDRNLITAAYLKSRGAARAIALIADSTFGAIADKLGVDVAVPVRDTVVDAIMSHLRGRNVKSVHSICNRTFEIIECFVGANADVAGKTLREIAHPGEFLVLLVRRPGASDWEVPRADTPVEGGARAVLITRRGDPRTLRLFCGKD